MKKLFGFLFICALMSIATPGFTARYRIADLGHLGGNRTHPHAINNYGKSTGYSFINNWDHHAFLYDDRNIIDLGTFGGFSSGIDINDFDVVVGTSGNMSGFNRPFIWKNGVMSDLGTLDGYDSGGADGINNSGQVIGLLHVKNDVDNSSWRAALWEKGRIRKLFEIPSIAHGINDLGQVVGGFKNNAGEWRAFIWENKKTTDLGIVGGPAKDINNFSQIVGHLTEHYGGVDHNHPFLWENGTLNDLRLPNEINGQALAINNRGQVVGISQDESYNTHAVLWEGGTWYYLDDLIPPDSGVEYLAFADDINDKGQIVAYGVIGDFAHGFILTPIPTIEIILDFFDDSVANGTIYGSGKKLKISNLKLWLFSQTLETAEYFIKKDKIKYSCKALNRAFLRCDSNPRPIDFVKGEAVEELEDMILELMDELGCE